MCRITMKILIREIRIKGEIRGARKFFKYNFDAI